jgi:hypothetical protein
MVTENERLRLPINQNILAASPYIVVHTVHRVQQLAHPVPLPVPNIQHQAQYDPGVNISTENNINVLRNSVELEHPFPIKSADRNVPAMTASIRGTFVLLLSDRSNCDIPMYIVHPWQIPSFLLSNSPVLPSKIIDTMANVSLTFRVAAIFSCHIPVTTMHPSFPSRISTTCISFLDRHLAPLDIVSILWPPKLSFYLRSDTSILATQVKNN